MKGIILGCLCLLQCLMLQASCSADDDVALITLEVASKTADFKAGQQTGLIGLKTNANECRTTVDESGKSWCSASVNIQTQQIAITVSENKGKEIRETKVLVKAGSLTETIVVRQLGIEDAILVSPSVFSLEAVGGNLKFAVTANVDFEIVTPAWIQKSPAARSAGMVTTEHRYSVLFCKSEEKRSGEIIIKSKRSTVQAKVIITQAGVGKYQAAGLDGIKDDLKVKAARGEASSVQPGLSIEKTLDGDYNTNYESAWSNSGANYFPITLTYYFENAPSIDYLVYHPRVSGSNGNFKQVEIRVSTEKEPAFKKVKEIDMAGSDTPTRVLFDAPLEAPKAIQFIVKSGSGDGKGYAVCSEMEFYQRNPDKFDPLTLFTDATCSELKTGVTEAQMDACTYPFFRNMAYYMYVGKYSREFRIQDYKAYLHPDVQSVENKTSPYSLLDNPTGISVKESEDILVFVGDMHGEKLSLKIQNLDVPNGDGYGGSSYPLSEGMNRIKTRNKGLIYVMYHTPRFETAQPVKIHIASGQVNGYFDVAKHTASQWKDLLAQATDKYFDVVGKYAHLTYPVARFKEYTPDGKALIDVYDEIVRREMELMGLFKYNRVFKNRMYFNVMYHSYMYATSYHTAYHDGTLPELCKAESLRKEAIWGPAHEVGHCNQTRPGLSWLGMTEVTNNILSQYVQTSFGNVSRLQGESLKDYGGFTNRFESAMTNMFSTRYANAQEPDVFCKLVPFWQLHLYVDNVLGQKDFYKDVFEKVRVNPDRSKPGESQLDFVLFCCDVAQLDLTDFFERWGFLKPIKLVVEDYSTGTLEVTQAQVDAVIKQIRSKGYPKPAVRFEYICDNSVDLYRNPQRIQTGTAVRDGRILTMKEWKNVAAYEVYRGDKLIFVSTFAGFTVNQDLDSSCQVYAVAATGEKVKVKF